MDNCLEKYMARCGPLQTGTSPSVPIRLFDLVAEPTPFPGKWRIPGPVIGRKMSGDAECFAKIQEHFADKDEPVTQRNKEANTEIDTGEFIIMSARLGKIETQIKEMSIAKTLDECRIGELQVQVDLLRSVKTIETQSISTSQKEIDEIKDMASEATAAAITAVECRIGELQAQVECKIGECTTLEKTLQEHTDKLDILANSAAGQGTQCNLEECKHMIIVKTIETQNNVDKSKHRMFGR